MDRRKFVSRSLATLALSQAANSPLLAMAAQEPPVGKKLPVWSPGHLEIHHIATNRGSATLLILPDRTTMLIDAGAVYGDAATLGDARPSEERRPGEYIGRYCQRRVLDANLWGLDYFVASNLNVDRLGAIPPDAKPNAEGYIETGVADVATWMPIKHFIDRGWPDYNYPAPQDSDFLKNYRAFLAAKKKRGATVERFKVATKDQIPLLHNPMSFPTCEVRNIACNGVVWSGNWEEAASRFPDIDKLKPEDYPTENMCSAALRIRYGRFRYYTGGDLTCDTEDGTEAWRDIETPVTKVCGKVSVAAADHHGASDANGENFAKALKAKVFVVPSWGNLNQPSGFALEMLGSTDIYPDDRDIFTTSLKEASNHVVIRVEPGGQHFSVHLISNRDETDHVLATLGPYGA